MRQREIIKQAVWIVAVVVSASCHRALAGRAEAQSSTAAESFAHGVVVHLGRLAPSAKIISFGVPVMPHALADVKAVRVGSSGSELPAQVRELLGDYDATGAHVGVRAFLVQFPVAYMKSSALDVSVTFDRGPAKSSAQSLVPYQAGDVSMDSAEQVRTAIRTVVARGGAAMLQESAPVTQTLFVGREPRVLATFPPGYLAATGVLGPQIARAQAMAPDRAGIKYLSDALIAYAHTAVFDESYALNPDPDSVPDPKTSYEGWLYDRCATLLISYVHSGEAGFLRHGLRSCSWYARQIRTSGPEAGTFAGKPESDPKYSHVRGLYAYYALTGDEEALSAARAIADMWLADPSFVAPYRLGHTRGPDRLWTERLLATSLEAMIYGHQLTGDRRYLQAFRDLFATAYRHITGDAAALAQINPGVSLPPQDCFIHNAAQHGEGDRDQPWCSGWMVELMVDPLLRYQDQTKDERVDDVFIRLTRFLRDTGSAYFHNDELDDHFLSPAFCDNSTDHQDRRRLVPIYGSGIAADGHRRRNPEYDDSLHCPDATALTAAALRALKRRGLYDQHPIGPFASEGESFRQLFEEFSFCAELAFGEQARPGRAPSAWSAEELKAGLADPGRFIHDKKIGYPSRQVSPARKLSWWFNTSLEQFALLREAGIAVPQLKPGKIPGPPCK